MTLPRHHPGEALLLDYASGLLAEPVALAIATHLACCPACRHAVTEMEAVGGALLEGLEPEPVAAGSLEAVMARLDRADARLATAPARPSPAAATSPLFPEPLRRYAGEDGRTLRWTPMVPGMSCAVVPVGGAGRSVGMAAKARLMRMRGNLPMPRHTHAGVEITVVLDGGFHDELGAFARGDLSFGDASIDHQPVADPEGCLCLSVTMGPLRLTGAVGRFLNPFLSF